MTASAVLAALGLLPGPTTPPVTGVLDSPEDIRAHARRLRCGVKGRVAGWSGRIRVPAGRPCVHEWLPLVASVASVCVSGVRRVPTRR